MKREKSSPDNFDELEPPSKSAVKREMLALQDLGKVLCDLPYDRVKRSPASERLLDAIADYHKCKAHGAKKRQLQFVGKVMRDENAEEIEAWVNGETVEQKLQILHMHAAEQWRDALIAQPESLATFIESYPDAARAGLNTIIRAASQERANNKAPRNYRALYQSLYQIIKSAEPVEQDIEVNEDE